MIWYSWNIHLFSLRLFRYGLLHGVIEIHGTPGNGLGAYLDGAEIIVHGNAQDAVGDTANDGRIIVYGSIAIMPKQRRKRWTGHKGGQKECYSVKIIRMSANTVHGRIVRHAEPCYVITVVQSLMIINAENSNTIRTSGLQTENRPSSLWF